MSRACWIVLVLVSVVAQARADDAVVDKTSIVVTTYNHEGFYKTAKVRDDLTNSWTPRIEFNLVGPSAAGGQVVIDFAIAGKKWTLEVAAPELKPGQSQRLEALGNDVPLEKAATATGDVAFTIHLKNELAGSDTKLFEGKASVKKYLPSHLVGNAKYANAFQYYIDQDFRLPIGLLAWSTKQGVESPYLTAQMWMRGNVWESKDVAYIFYEGKQYCSTTNYANGTVTSNSWSSGNGDEAPTWSRATIYFNCTRAFDKHDASTRLPEDTFHMVDKHPGKYEIKLLRSGKLSRSMAFTIADDGHLVEDAAAATELRTQSVVVPVKLLFTEDGNAKTPDKNAWKTGFYGNKLSAVKL
jgi:hypothetical protein